MMVGQQRFDVSQHQAFKFILRAAGTKSIVLELAPDGNGASSGSVAVYLGEAVGAQPWLTVKASTLRVYPSPETDYVTLVPSSGALGLCTVSLSQEQLGVGIFPFEPAGSAGVTGYEYTATEPATVWDIVHNLNRYCSVTAIDTTLRPIVGDVQYLSLNELTITFSAAVGGSAYLI
jgi:hypothetical protein